MDLYFLCEGPPAIETAQVEGWGILETPLAKHLKIT